MDTATLPKQFGLTEVNFSKIRVVNCMRLARRGESTCAKKRRSFVLLLAQFEAKTGHRPRTNFGFRVVTARSLGLRPSNEPDGAVVHHRNNN
ncbi:hypothetical protein [Lacisediminimonas sp.]|uniref:hypothetical protein n=1 Tax=Lacisediminimonas sp. TaxID=3060582 RepID=UPI0027245BB6|nr:hypothetical protein [Lacisediminimonas sp.]MDO8298150.1 hypothetical protein [Lacisediminimonas sp.]